MSRCFSCLQFGRLWPQWRWPRFCAQVSRARPPRVSWTPRIRRPFHNRSTCSLNRLWSWIWSWAFAAMPPRLLEAVAARAGMSVEQLRAGAQKQVEAVLSDALVENVQISTDAKGGFVEAAPGLIYGYLPMQLFNAVGRRLERGVGRRLGSERRRRMVRAATAERWGARGRFAGLSGAQGHTID